MKKVFDFRKMVNGKGYLCKITYSLSVSSSSRIPELDVVVKDKIWESPCKTGCLIFFDFYKRKNNNSLHIVVDRIDWLPRDTYSTIVMFSMIFALMKELNFKIQGVHFDENGIFSIPGKP